jgi:SH3-like domain-containing protein
MARLSDIRPSAVAAFGAGCLVLTLVSAAPIPARAGAADTPGAATPPAGQVSGLPVPRFVSLKSDQVNLRSGPGKDYPASWVFKRAGLPVEVVKEFDIWREVRDAEGTKGWVIQSLLSGRRTALVLPWDAKPGVAPKQTEIRRERSDTSRPVVMVEAGVIASILACDGRWCHVAIDRYRGYIEQKKLWGVYEGEVVK